MLSYNPKNRLFFLYSDDAKKARDVGLTLSTKITGPDGEKCWFTDSPYAAMVYYDVADEKARNIIDPIWNDYQESWINEGVESEIPAPPGLEYMPFQKAGIEFAYNKGNVLIGDDMGLGKTIQGIGLANKMNAKHILVVVPASVRFGWESKIHLWSTISNVKTLVCLSGIDAEAINPFYNYVIVSYNLATNKEMHKRLRGIEWDLLILDEAHYLKTPTAKRTRAIFGGGIGDFQHVNLINHCKKVCALTGTPLLNRPKECYTLARGLHWESIDWASEEAFENRYNKPKTREYPEIKGRLPELHARLRSNFMIRRLKEEVLEDLPDKNYEMTYLEPDGQITEVLAKQKLVDFDPRNFVKSNIDSEGHISTLRREMGEAKVDRVASHIQYLLDIQGVQKLVVGFHHHTVRELLVDKLYKYGIHVYHGKMTPKAKQQSFDTFIEDGEKSKIFLGQLNSAGEGLDGLQHICQYVVFAEIAWTPSGNQQFIDRIFRIGQHDNVIAQFLISPGSFDERILNVVLEKELNIFNTVDNKIKG